MDEAKNRILVGIDGSYWLYTVLFSAVTDFMKKFPTEAHLWIKDPEETDQKNLPDLTMNASFVKVLKKTVMKKCEAVDWMLKANFQDQIDTADSIDFVFAMDDRVSKNFRKEIYPEYKANRRLLKRSYDAYKIQQYIVNVIFKELGIEDKYSYHIIKVSGAEGDDILATLFKKFGSKYSLSVLFASDRDFMQLENVEQLNMQGKKVECKLGEEPVTHSEYLLSKILLGDGSDNIMKVFPKVGYKRVIPLLRDREALKAKLKESQDAIKQFNLNKKLISFDEIPEELSKSISEAISTSLYREEELNSQIDFKTFMMM